VRPGTERRLYFEEKPRPDLEVTDTDARRGVGPRRGVIGLCPCLSRLGRPAITKLSRSSCARSTSPTTNWPCPNLSAGNPDGLRFKAPGIAGGSGIRPDKTRREHGAGGSARRPPLAFLRECLRHAACEAAKEGMKSAPMRGGRGDA